MILSIIDNIDETLTQLTAKEADKVPVESRKPYIDIAADTNKARGVWSEIVVPCKDLQLKITRNNRIISMKWRPARFYYLEDRIRLENAEDRCRCSLVLLFVVKEKPKYLRQYLQDWEALTAEQKKPYEDRSEECSSGKKKVAPCDLYKELYRDYIIEQFNVPNKSMGYKLLMEEYAQWKPSDQIIIKEIAQETAQEASNPEFTELQKLKRKRDAESCFIREQFPIERKRTKSCG